MARKSRKDQIRAANSGQALPKTVSQPVEITYTAVGYARLSVVHGLVDEPLDAGLSVENRILGVYVKMYELRHDCVTIMYMQR